MSSTQLQKLDTYLRVAELWRCDERGQFLTLAAGYYANHTRFEHASRGLTFPLGLGLIGRCAQLGRPVLLDELSPDNGFLRSEAARGEGLTVGLALPIDKLAGNSGVLALFFAHAPLQASGGVEVWERSNVLAKLALSHAHHGVAEDFRRVTSQLTFDLGVGMPGRLAQGGIPEVIARFDEPGNFIRSVAAESAGFDHAVGIPGRGSDQSVVVLLGHAQQPIVRHAAIWRHDLRSAFEVVATHQTDAAFESTDYDAWLQLAKQSQEPVVFEAHGPTDRDPVLGGLILPFFVHEGISYACSLCW